MDRVVSVIAFGAGALFLPSLIVPVMLTKVIDEHDVAVYIFL